MSISFVVAVDAELAGLTEEIATLRAEQANLTPRIFVLLGQLNTLKAYRRTLALGEMAPGSQARVVESGS